MRNTLTQIFAVLLIVLSISTAVAWEFYFDDRINTVSVLKATHNMPRGKRIAPTDFSALRVKADAVPEGVITSIEALKDCETVIPVGKGMILVKNFFDEPGIVPNGNQMITPVPDQWIYSLPGSLRRKDLVSIYEYPVSNPHSSNAPVNTPLAADRQPSLTSILSNKPLLENIVVAFAKDSVII